VVTEYYFHALSMTGGSRVAMDREGVVQWLVGDHLGSTSLVLDDQGSVVAEARHYTLAAHQISCYNSIREASEAS